MLQLSNKWLTPNGRNEPITVNILNSADQKRPRISLFRNYTAYQTLQLQSTCRSHR